MDFWIADPNVTLTGEMTFFIDGGWVTISSIEFLPSEENFQTRTFLVPVGEVMKCLIVKIS